MGEVLTRDALQSRVKEAHASGRTVAFANGCFDLLHRGHIKLLAEARATCDRLVVGLNSDASTRRLKGESRPINPVEGRAEVLAALEAVDLVVVFEEDTPLELIRRVRPTALIKGGHLEAEEVVDIFFDGNEFRTWRRPKIETQNSHGTGCTLSAAIAAGLAAGSPLQTAVEDGLDYVYRAILEAPDLGSGHGPLNHFVAATGVPR